MIIMLGTLLIDQMDNYMRFSRLGLHLLKVMELVPSAQSSMLEIVQNEDNYNDAIYVLGSMPLFLMPDLMTDCEQIVDDVYGELLDKDLKKIIGVYLKVLNGLYEGVDNEDLIELVNDELKDDNESSHIWRTYLIDAIEEMNTLTDISDAVTHPLLNKDPLLKMIVVEMADIMMSNESIDCLSYAYLDEHAKEVVFSYINYIAHITSNELNPLTLALSQWKNDESQLSQIIDEAIAREETVYIHLSVDDYNFEWLEMETVSEGDEDYLVVYTHPSFVPYSSRMSLLPIPINELMMTLKNANDFKGIIFNKDTNIMATLYLKDNSSVN